MRTKLFFVSVILAMILVVSRSSATLSALGPMTDSGDNAFSATIKQANLGLEAAGSLQAPANSGLTADGGLQESLTPPGLETKPQIAAGAPTIEWITQFGTAYLDDASSIATGPQGDIFVTGMVERRPEGEFNGPKDALLTRFDSLGHQQCYSSVETSKDDVAGDIAVSSTNDVYVAEWMGGLDDGDAGLARYDVNCQIQWRRILDSGNFELATDVAIDAQGDIYFAGYTLGNLGGPHQGLYDPWLAKYNKNGNQQWIRQFGTSANESVKGMAVDSDNNVYLVGQIDQVNVWLARISPEGTLLWSRTIIEGATAEGMTIDSADNIYLTGRTTGSLWKPNAGKRDVWLAKYNRDGDQLWGEQFGSSESEAPIAIAVNPAGDVFLTGYTEGNLAGPLSSPHDIWVAGYDGSGSQQWLHQIDTPNYELVSSIAVDSLGPIYLAGDTSGDWGGPSAGSTDVFILKLIPPDIETKLELIGLEVTQVIQNWHNEVPLFTDKPTFVRAHVRSNKKQVKDIKAYLKGTRNGSPLPDSPLPLANKGGTINVITSPFSPDRDTLNDSFLFELPPAWRHGTIDLEVVADSVPINCKEHANTDDDCQARVTFVDPPTAEVSFVGLGWGFLAEGHMPTRAEVREMANFVEAGLPVAKLNWSHTHNLRPRYARAPTTVDRFLRYLNMLARQRILDGCISRWPFNCGRYYMGILVDQGEGAPPPGTLAGLAFSGPSDVAAGYNDGETILHELGHAAGRAHILCSGTEPNPDPTYPYPRGYISEAEAGDNAFYGFNSDTKETHSSIDGDIMSYCPYTWPSDWTYNKIREELENRFGSASANLAAMAGEPAFVIDGVLSPTLKTGEFSSILAIDVPAAVTAPDPGPYTIRFEDGAGQTLAAFPFEPNFSPNIDDENELGAFVLLLPRDPNAARIVLLHNGDVLAERTASANLPVVTINSPNGGESLSGSTTTINWSASDLDGDSLTFVIQYSPDADTTWQTLASELTSTSYELQLDYLAGSDQALLRVLVSDGFHTGQDVSDGIFSIAKHAPEAYIQTPENHSLYVFDQLIILEGQAYDNEDGLLDGNSSF